MARITTQPAYILGHISFWAAIPVLMFIEGWPITFPLTAVAAFLWLTK